MSEEPSIKACLQFKEALATCIDCGRFPIDEADRGEFWLFVCTDEEHKGQFYTEVYCPECMAIMGALGSA